VNFCLNISHSRRDKKYGVMTRTCRFLLQGQSKETDGDRLRTQQAVSVFQYVTNTSYHHHTVVTIQLIPYVQPSSVILQSLSAHEINCDPLRKHPLRRDCNTLKWATEAVGCFGARGKRQGRYVQWRSKIASLLLLASTSDSSQ
jgi:hypothetical protein